LISKQHFPLLLRSIKLNIDEVKQQELQNQESQIRTPRTKDPYDQPMAVMQETPQKPEPSPEIKRDKTAQYFPRTKVSRTEQQTNRSRDTADRSAL
jgi:hypothetical protein